MHRIEKSTQFLKVTADDQGLIIGYGMICKEHGEDFYDSDNQCFDEHGMLEATTDFAKSGRGMAYMHARDADGNPIQVGEAIHSFPLTSEIAKALEIEPRYTGWLVAVQPHSEEILEKARNGELNGFSIGGYVVEVEDEDE